MTILISVISAFRNLFIDYFSQWQSFLLSCLIGLGFDFYILRRNHLRSLLNKEGTT